MIYCFEAFHHARDFRSTLSRLSRRLRPEGKFILFGEPFIDESMWPTWGLRLDPLSIYCIAKFGWWESGWTRAFMASVFRSAGLLASFVDEGSDLERYMVGSIGGRYSVDQLSYRPVIDGWARDRTYLVSRGDSRLEFYRPLREIVLGIENFAPFELWVRFESPALTAPVTINLARGPNQIALPISTSPQPDPWEIRISSQTWNPHQELGAGEERDLSFHLESVTEIPAETA